MEGYAIALPWLLKLAATREENGGCLFSLQAQHTYPGLRFGFGDAHPASGSLLGPEMSGVSRSTKSLRLRGRCCCTYSSAPGAKLQKKPEMGG